MGGIVSGLEETMPVPLDSRKYQSEAFFAPTDFIGYIRGLGRLGSRPAPEAVILSCFNPIRREVARIAIERLVSDGRIHPARIEEIVSKVAEELEEKIGAPIVLSAVVDMDCTNPRKGLTLGELPLSSEPAKVLDDPSIDIVVELIGGLEPARSFILRALANGKHVVTANKALLATHGEELYAEARERGRMLAFEAAVAGGIPLIRSVKEGLVANRITSIQSLSSISIIISVFLTLCIHGTCLSPIPSILCPPKPFISSVGHCKASAPAILHDGYFFFR